MTQQPLHNGRLILTPQSPYWAREDLSTLIEKLHSIGLIEQPLANQPKRFLLGDEFMRWVSFMGCSPFIRLSPGDEGEAFCHLAVDGPSPRPRLITGRNTTPPRCEACRKRITDWQQAFEAWREQAAGWMAACPHCGHEQDPASYDFRQTAGCGRLFLSIENIFPQEAIPDPGLLTHLQTASDGQPWHYFYQQDATL
ncbi:MAG: hypothetical protein ABW076_10180 [Candidatus Thiodiazotropha sp.]